MVDRSSLLLLLGMAGRLCGWRNRCSAGFGAWMPGGGGSTGTLPLLKLASGAPPAMRCAAGPALRAGASFAWQGRYVAAGASIDQMAVVRSAACWFAAGVHSCPPLGHLQKESRKSREGARRGHLQPPPLSPPSVPTQPLPPFRRYWLHPRRTHQGSPSCWVIPLPSCHIGTRALLSSW